MIATMARQTVALNLNPMPEIEAGGLGMPAYANAAIGSAVARCRVDGGSLYRVTAVNDRNGERFGYDLPYGDASSMARDLMFNRGYSEVTLCRVR